MMKNQLVLFFIFNIIFISQCYRILFIFNELFSNWNHYFIFINNIDFSSEFRSMKWRQQSETKIKNFK
jgi:hypothetical protein